jgi:hypothetical protein
MTEPDPAAFRREPVLSLSERIDRALQGSLDRCARCKTCDYQVDAVLGVLSEVLAEKEPPLPEGEYARVEIVGHDDHAGWVTTRSQLTGALTRLTAEVPLYGHQTANVNTGSMADAILAQLPQAARTFTEYAVAWGGEDPNECAGISGYDDEAGAEEMTQWIIGGYVARRTVMRSRWERVAAGVLHGAQEAADVSRHAGPYADRLGSAETVSVALSPARPRVVCLCDSTRFGNFFHAANLRLTLAGEIVLSIGCDTKNDADLAAAGDLGHDVAQAKVSLDELHKRKIDMADYVHVVSDESGYFGNSTLGEIEYALAHGKPVTYANRAAAMRARNLGLLTREPSPVASAERTPRGALEAAEEYLP